jgi:amino acid transporter
MPASTEVRKKEKDVAKATILVLLILTILLSVISTWYILDTITSVKKQYQSIPSISHAKVSVSIAPRPGTESESAPKESAPVTGKVSLTLIRP